jgi:hypothetical protein
MVGKITSGPARRRKSRRSVPVDQYLGPGDGTPHDDYVYAGWEKLDPYTRYGSPIPRIYTKPRGPLVPEVLDADGNVTQRATTWGYEVIDFARDILDIELMPWQRWLFIHMLELEYDDDDDDLDPLLRFEKVVVLVARQNGKSTLSQVLALWFMLMAKWPVVLGTAQDLPTAEKILNGAVEILTDDDELREFVGSVSGTNGQKSMTLTTGEEYIVKAASRASGRGLTGNLIMLDELGMQKTWASWSAITKTTQAQELSLILGLSNAGDMTSVVLLFLRLAAHRELGDPDGLLHEDMQIGPQVIDIDPKLGGGDDEEPLTEEEIEDLLDDMEPDEGSIFLAEWSTAPDKGMRDREGWAQANPALGHRITERKIAGQVPPNEPEWTFRTEVLCQWPDATLVGPFPAGTWEKGQNKPGGTPEAPKVRDEDRMIGTMDLAIDQSSDRGQASIVAAGTRADGVDQVVLIAKRPGTDWIRDFLINHVDRKRFRRITGQGRGAPITPFMTDLTEKPIAGIEVVPLVGVDLTNACANFYDAVRDTKVRHHISPPLDIAAKTAETNHLGDGSMVYDRKASPTDIGPLMAAAGAFWLHQKKLEPPPPPPPPPRAVTPDSSSSAIPSMDGIGTMAF